MRADIWNVINYFKIIENYQSEIRSNNYVDVPTKEKLEQQRIERLKKKGLKEFRYGDNIVYAINKKNADRKARKLGYIK